MLYTLFRKGPRDGTTRADQVDYYLKMAENQAEKMDNESGSGTKENKIILLTIKNAVYPITTDVIQRVANRSGQIDRIVIFKKKFVQVSLF